MYKWFLLILLWAASSSLIPSQTIVKTLPGYPGPLPFKLETGYIGVGEDEDVQLFYFFVESEGNPEVDPLIIWLAGGPGCSNLHAFFFEIGPLKILNGNYIDDVPALQVDPNSWTKLANIIYLDGPTLTGYSYTTTSEAARSSDTLSASQTTEFIRKFVRDHPRFLKNPMYVTGISYSGIGYMAGNPLTNKSGDINSRFEFAYQMALISKDLFESTKEDCNGEYAEANDKNTLCISRINEVNKRVSDINMSQILEPICGNSTSKLLPTVNQIRMRKQRSVRENPIMIVHAQPSVMDAICNVDYFYAMLWANNRNVMKALNVRKGRVTEENLCNMDMKYDYGYTSLPLYEFNVQSSVVHHEELSKRNCRALIFSGDHDMTIPHVGTYNWIKSLNLTITESNWDAWYSNGQVAGFKTTYAHDNYSLVFATVKGGGHTVPQYKPKQCFDMVKRWFAHESI
ncbi:peptidase S10, serine carboxypeptidase, Alpha/Beta hydrolase fold protein [Artemisia annua]|uniref:Peptidase S10, serine carboxypeptidase, Alpha/Beta hydrolase fold protein n=1 Tax=Artemisia annua TaxID=35608 RepID=A0A2U1N2H2_ARTAN|nr:peptidase S10, serine carboxypeptidase, Alpha/Beta hydrolase fold protein [Artemisia annua]